MDREKVLYARECGQIVDTPSGLKVECANGHVDWPWHKGSQFGPSVWWERPELIPPRLMVKAGRILTRSGRRA